MVLVYVLCVAVTSLFILIICNIVIARPLHQSSTPREKFKNKARRKEIPRKIWTYWDEAETPPFVQKCIDTWRYHNPDFEINVLHRHNHEKFTGMDVYTLKLCEDNAVRSSDFIRLMVLEKYGGIWMDASIVCFKPLSFFDTHLRSKDFIGFKIEKFVTDERYPVIENWSFACVPKAKFVTRWLAECLKMHNFPSLDAFVDDLHQNKKVDLQNIEGPSYLACHSAAQYVMQKIPDSYNMHCFNAAGDNPIFGKGPFFYIMNNGWDNVRGLEALCSDGKEEYTDSTFIKLRGAERIYLIAHEHLQKCVFDLAYRSRKE